MLDKAAFPQFDAGVRGTVLNVHRLTAGQDEPTASFTPRSLTEHAHPTLQVSVLLRESIAAVGWQTGGGKAAGRRLRGGQAYVVPSDQPHDFRLYRPDGMVNFHIDPQALVALDPARFEGRPHLVDEVAVMDDPTTAGLAAGVHAACQAPGGLTPLYLDAAWTMLAVHLLHRLRPGASPDPARVRASLPARRLARVLEYVEAHAADDIRVSDLAGLVALSPVQFTRLFTQAVGASPMQHVIERRLERARALLARDDLPISQIALEAGFGTHARFAEAFRKRFGQTPSQWRISGARLLT